MASVNSYFGNFNSIKVQLELDGFKPVCEVAPEFQFHKGTIRTYQITQKRKVMKKNFNSIKVQLELRDRRRTRAVVVISIP